MYVKYGRTFLCLIMLITALANLNATQVFAKTKERARTTTTHPDPQKKTPLHKNKKRTKKKPTSEVIIKKKKTKKKVKKESKKKPKLVLFSVSDSTPSGFRRQKGPMNLFVDIYYLRSYLGYFAATVNGKNIRFKKPNRLIKKLAEYAELKNVDALKKALSKPLPQHQHLSCNQVKRPLNCGYLKPKIIGLIYDSAKLRAHLFIQQNYLKRKKQISSYLPKSTSGLSLSNHFLVRASGTFNEGEPTLNFTNDYTAAFGNDRIELSLSLNRTSEEQTLTLNELAMQGERGQYYYLMGVMEEQAYFFTRLKLLGLQAGTTLDTTTNQDLINSTPVELFLTLPSEVSVFKGDRILYARYFDAGHQLIDSTRFPEGYYPLTIKIKDARGTKEQTLYFIKSTLLPPLKVPQYHMTLGYLTNEFASKPKPLIALRRVPFYKFDYAKRLSRTLGLNMQVIGHHRGMYLNIGTRFLNPKYLLEPRFLIGSQDTLGVGFDFRYQTERLNTTLIFLHFLRTKYHLHPITKTATDPREDNDLFLADDYITNFTLGYRPTLDSSINALATITASKQDAKRVTYSIAYNRNLMDTGRTTLDLNSTLSLKDDVYDFKIGLSLRLKLKYIDTHKEVSMTGREAEATRISPVLRIGGDYRSYDENRHGYTVGVDVRVSNDNKNIAMQYKYTHRLFDFNGNLNRIYRANEDPILQYAGSLSSSFNWVPYHFNVTSETSVQQTGIIADVHSDDKAAQFYLNTTFRQSKTLKANKPIFIPLPPYQTYRSDLTNASDRAFLIKNQTRHFTLYPGNIQWFDWKAVPKHLIIGQLVDHKKKPIAYAHIKQPSGAIMITDLFGYFQVNVDRASKWLPVEHDEKMCRIVLPTFSWDTNFTYIGETTCLSRK